MSATPPGGDNVVVMAMTLDSATTCPACGEPGAVPIVYGMPGDVATFEEADAGLIVLGGCLSGEDDPDAACSACGHRWRTPDRRV
jgi:hypothetical protein